MHKFLLHSHRLLGTILSIFFFLWFASGFVMLFYQFPRISSSERLRGLAPITLRDSVQEEQIDGLLAQMPDTLSLLSLKSLPLGKGYELSYKSVNESKQLRSDSLKSYSLDELKSYAQTMFTHSHIDRIDSVSGADTWVPYGPSSMYPLYKVYMQDDAGSELYLSPQTGEATQLTTRESRLGAYFGAIPHWIYFYQLRQHREAWANVILVLSGLGTLMCLAGMYLGIRTYWLTRKSKRGMHSPYKRWSYRWHHILGFFFGALVSIFVFSGFMSIQDVPEWIVPIKTDKASEARRQYFHIDREMQRQHIHNLIRDYQHEGIKRLECQSLSGTIYYRLSTDSTTHYLRANQDGVFTPLELSEAEIRHFVQGLSPQDKVSCTLLTEYDNYYIDRTHQLPLPVYRLEVDDVDGSSYYINPKTAELRYYNRNSRLGRTLYQGLHSWVFAPLVSVPWLWWSVIIVSLTAGLILSWTSLILSYRYIARLLKRKK